MYTSARLDSIHQDWSIRPAHSMLDIKYFTTAQEIKMKKKKNTQQPTESNCYLEKFGDWTYSSKMMLFLERISVPSFSSKIPEEKKLPFLLYPF